MARVKNRRYQQVLDEVIWNRLELWQIPTLAATVLNFYPLLKYYSWHITFSPTRLNQMHPTASIYATWFKLKHYSFVFETTCQRFKTSHYHLHNASAFQWRREATHTCRLWHGIRHWRSRCLRPFTLSLPGDSSDLASFITFVDSFSCCWFLGSSGTMSLMLQKHFQKRRYNVSQIRSGAGRYVGDSISHFDHRSMVAPFPVLISPGCEVAAFLRPFAPYFTTTNLCSPLWISTVLRVPIGRLNDP
jgi:hypothetical protein